MDWVNQLQKIKNKFKFQLFGRTNTNLEAFYNKAVQYDKNHTNSMPLNSFNLYLNACGVFFTKQQLTTIGNIFSNQSTNKPISINYHAFINNVREDISQKRKAAIENLYSQLSQGNPLTIQFLITIFKSNEHPHVRSMMQNNDNIKKDFETAIKKRSADGKHINQMQFIAYFYDVNACVPKERDQFFIDILISGFGLNSNRVTQTRLKQMEVTLYEKVRQKSQFIYFRTNEGTKSQNSFKYFDLEYKKATDYQRFSQTLQKLGCQFKPRQRHALYQKHANEQNVIQYESMCSLLFDMGSGNKQVLNPIYQLAKQGTGYITTHGMTNRLS